MTCCPIEETWKADQTLIKDYLYWKLLISVRQHTLGSCFLVLKRHAWHLSQLSDAEILNFNKVIKEIENALAKAFMAEHVNYFMLANQEKHASLHLIPRYPNSRKFAGREWVDVKYGRMPQMTQDNFDSHLLNEIKKEIQKNMGK